MKPKFLVGILPTNVGVVCAVVALGAPLAAPVVISFGSGSVAVIDPSPRAANHNADGPEEIVVHAEEVPS